MLSKSDANKLLKDDAYCDNLSVEDFESLLLSSFQDRPLIQEKLKNIFKFNVSNNSAFTSLLNEKLCSSLSDYDFDKAVKKFPHVALLQKYACERMTDKQFKAAVLDCPSKALESKWACNRMPYNDTSFPYCGIKNMAFHYPEISLYCEHVLDYLSDDVFNQLLEENKEIMRTQAILARKSKISLLSNEELCRSLNDNDFEREIKKFPSIALSQKYACERMTDKQFKAAVLAYPREALGSKWACKRMPYKDKSFPYNGLERLAREHPTAAVCFTHVLDILSDDAFNQFLEENPVFKEFIITPAISARKSKMLQNNDEVNDMSPKC